MFHECEKKKKKQSENLYDLEKNGMHFPRRLKCSIKSFNCTSPSTIKLNLLGARLRLVEKLKWKGFPHSIDLTRRWTYLVWSLNGYWETVCQEKRKLFSDHWPRRNLFLISADRVRWKNPEGALVGIRARSDMKLYEVSCSRSWTYRFSPRNVDLALPENGVSGQPESLRTQGALSDEIVKKKKKESMCSSHGRTRIRDTSQETTSIILTFMGPLPKNVKTNKITVQFFGNRNDKMLNVRIKSGGNNNRMWFLLRDIVNPSLILNLW